MSKRSAFLAGLVVLGSVALASPASDYYKEATDIIARTYFGTSTASVPDLIAKHKALLDTACLKEGDACKIDTAVQAISALAQELDWRIIRWPPAPAASTTAPRATFGFSQVMIPKYGEVQISNISVNSAADKAGLLPGDRITAISGKALGEQASVEAMTGVFSTLLSAIPDDQPATFTVVRGNLSAPTKLEIAVTRSLTNDGARPFLYTPPGAPAGVMVLRVPSLSWPPTAGAGQRAHDMVQEAKKLGATALILDLTDTTNGIYWTINAVAGAFLGNFEYTFRTRDTTATTGFKDGVGMGYPAQTSEPVANPAVWTGKLAILTSKRTIAGGEVLAHLLQNTAQAPVIGEETQGYVQVMPYMPRLSDGAEFLVPAYRIHDGKGNLLKERVIPDYPVAYNREEVAHTGVNPLFEQAYKVLGLK